MNGFWQITWAAAICAIAVNAKSDKQLNSTSNASPQDDDSLPYATMAGKLVDKCRSCPADLQSKADRFYVQSWSSLKDTR